MVEGGSCQYDGVLVGPFGGVAPGVLQGIPEVAPGRIADDPIREASPHQEGEVHLEEQWVGFFFISNNANDKSNKRQKKYLRNKNKKIPL